MQQLLCNLKPDRRIQHQYEKNSKKELNTYLWIIGWSKREFGKYPFPHIFYPMAVLGTHRYNLIDISKFFIPLQSRDFFEMKQNIKRTNKRSVRKKRFSKWVYANTPTKTSSNGFWPQVSLQFHPVWSNLFYLKPARWEAFLWGLLHLLPKSHQSKITQ